MGLICGLVAAKTAKEVTPATSLGPLVLLVIGLICGPVAAKTAQDALLLLRP